MATSLIVRLLVVALCFFAGATRAETYVDGGDNHTCAINSAGGVGCWGYNVSGQLGDGTTTDRSIVTSVAGLGSDITGVATGDSHSCALSNSGSIKCWGSNAYGQLGDGSLINRTSSVSVSGMASGYSKITAGGAHSCALGTTGAVKCWGYNASGQIGDGTQTNRTSPVSVTGLAGTVTALASGYQHQCALLDTGAVQCWGRNTEGQLGDGSNTQRLTPVTVSGLSSGVLAITAGEVHSCALLNSGALKCWGGNSSGQLGDASTTNRNTPVDVSGMGSGVQSVTSQANHTCAVSTTGVMSCWGFNSDGQLGDGTTSNRLTPVPVSGLPLAVSLAAPGRFHSCALVVNGDVYCWGLNTSKQVGDNTTTQRLLPVHVVHSQSIIVTALPASESYGASFVVNASATSGLPVSIQVGGECTLSGTTVTLTHGAGGCNIDLGQTGNSLYVAAPQASYFVSVIPDGDEDGTADSVDTDDDNDGVEDVSDNCPAHVNLNQTDSNGDGIGDACDKPDVRIAAGHYHSCAITAAGAVNCWGSNYYGQLGDDSNTYSSTPVTVSGLEGMARSVAVGTYHSCALLVDGSVRCWGNNFATTPVTVNGLLAPVVAISTAGQSTCALLKTGGVQCWGNNGYGQLGDGTYISRTTAVSVAGQTAGVLSMDLGFSHGCSLIINGSVKCWGDNSYGKLGNGAISGAQNIPVTVSGITSGDAVRRVVLGSAHSCAVLADGTMKCWGQNSSGQLGDGTTNSSLIPVSVTALALGIDDQVDSYGTHQCAMVADGIKCWGSNSSGQLGDGTIDSPRLSAVSVQGLAASVAEITVGNLHTCALLVTGQLQCWGSNTSGQPGPAFVTGFGDSDIDEIADSLDNCPTVFNLDQLNTDGDAQGNVCDFDDDNDVVLDINDAFPLDATETLDTDGDGIGNNADLDDDNDGIPDDIDTEPFGVIHPLVNAPYVSIAVGAVHYCALTSVGAVECWGNNEAGQLGVPVTLEFSNVPVAVIGLPETTLALGLGGMHSCALSHAGVVRCWGANDRGQLGIGSAVEYSVSPVTVTGLGANVSAIAVSGNHACALTNSGSVLCWGDNYYGQLGDGSYFNRSTPVWITGGMRAIAVGESHTCAVAWNATVKCWGRNENGQLGDGSLLNSNVPVDVAGLASGVESIAVGGAHTCVILENHTVQCWGENSGGQLGNGTFVDGVLPATVSVVGSTAASIVAGSSHTCLIDLDGVAWCWGANYSGALGNGTTENSAIPVQVSGLIDVVQEISANAYATCARVQSGSIYCWGYVEYIGDGSVVETAVPLPVKYSQTITVNQPAPPSASPGDEFEVGVFASSGLPVTVSAYGGCHVNGLQVVMDQGSVSCWLIYEQAGNDLYLPVKTDMQLIMLTLPDTDMDNQLDALDADDDNDGILDVIDNCQTIANASQSDVDQDGIGDACELPQSSLRSGESHSCYVTPDNSLFCWGDNRSRQMASTSPTYQLSPVAVSTMTGNTAAVGAGYSRSCSVALNGNVYCWGAGSSVPTLRTGLPAAAVAVVSGESHYCALLQTGAVYCWGTNGDGQLGDGTYSSSSIPVLVKGLAGGMRSLVAAKNHTCALAATGDLLCWGANQSGQLGNGSFTKSNAPALVLALPAAVQSVSVGEQHSCAVTQTGAAYCWGSNSYLQLGVSSSTVPNSALPVQVTDLSTGVNNIISGWSHNCVLMNTGDLKCWGRNSDGQLGNGQTINRPTPVQTMSGVTSLSAGARHTCAVSGADNLYCWGNNTYGQLGVGTTVAWTYPKLLRQNQTITVTEAAPVSAVYGSSFTVSATASSGLPVTISAGGGCVSNGNTITMTSGVINCTVRFKQAGQLPFFGAAPDLDRNVTAQKISQHISLDVPPPGSASFQGQFTVQASTSCNLPVSIVAGNGCSLSGNTVTMTSGTQGCYLNFLQAGSLDCEAASTVQSYISVITDSDEDGIPDSEDLDADNDIVPDLADNCPFVSNVSQQDSDQDGTGDACETVTARVTAGGDSACSIDELGKTFCWGEVLGNGTSGSSTTPVHVSALTNLSVAVEAGEDMVCAVSGSGAVSCWGPVFRNSVFWNPVNAYEMPISILNAGVLEVSAGREHACAVLESGGISCWGQNSNCAFGNGQCHDLMAGSVVPTAVQTLGLPAIHVAAGSEHTCAVLSNRSVKCWGKNASWQLGNGPSECTGYCFYPAEDQRYPIDVVGLSGPVANITAGDGHTCALLQVGTVQCWGDNSYGQLGDGTTVRKMNPVFVSGLGNQVQAIRAGGEHTCALMLDGSVRCWGRNASGQLGDGTTFNRLLPVAVTGLADIVKEVGTGHAHTCALLGNNRVQCWGSNSYGQLGNGTLQSRLLPDIVRLDLDGDGIIDAEDAFPLDPAETLDADNDGIGNNADLDDDGDGVPDYIDADPLSAAVNTESIMPLEGMRKGTVIRDAMSVQ